MEKQVLGVKIDDITLDEAVNTVEGWLNKGRKYHIVTPNPEFIVAAQSDKKFKDIINNADLAIPDGAGLRLTGEVKNRVTGMDLMERLVSEAAQKDFSIGLLGGRDTVAQKSARALQKKYPKLTITFAQEGGEAVTSSGETVSLLLGIIPPTDILFVAFGHPKQEKWIAGNLENIPVKVAMGVGGAFDYISGQVPRAPKIIRDLGFEWLFRLIMQPWRIKRQLALLEYVWLLTRERLGMISSR